MTASTATTTKSNGLKGFLLKLLYFILVLALFDFVVGTTLRHFYYKQVTGAEFKTRYAVDSTQEDILVFGSSRAEWIFNPAIIEDILHASCYNVGRNGHPILYHYALLQATLKRYHPKMIILSIDAGNFNVNQESYDKLSTLLPFYADHPEMRATLAMKSEYEKLKLLSRAYPYNSMLLPILSGNAALNKEKNFNIKGYSPLTKVFDEPLKLADYTLPLQIDTGHVRIFNSFLDDCKNAHVKLVLVCPPYILNNIGTETSIVIAKKAAAERGLPFMDYAYDTFYKSKPHLFSDYRHLNDKGVEIFTRSVADSIARLKW